MMKKVGLLQGALRELLTPRLPNLREKEKPQVQGRAGQRLLLDELVGTRLLQQPGGIEVIRDQYSVSG